MKLAEFRARLIQQNAEQSLEEIGGQLGVTHVTVGRWIRGERKPSDTVLLLAEKLWPAK